MASKKIDWQEQPDNPLVGLPIDEAVRVARQRDGAAAPPLDWAAVLSAVEPTRPRAGRSATFAVVPEGRIKDAR